MNPKENRTLLYDLKMRYGRRAQLYSYAPGELDPVTGIQANGIRVKWNIRRAIIFPPQMATKFQYDLAYITSNRNFTSGAEYDASEVWAIIDRKDVKGLTLTTQHYLVVGEDRYEIYSFIEMPDGSAYYIKARHLDGQLPYRIEEETACDTLAFEEAND